MRKPKYPNRIYTRKSSAEKASERYGGKGVKRVTITRMNGTKLKGWAIKW